MLLSFWHTSPGLLALLSGILPLVFFFTDKIPLLGIKFAGWLVRSIFCAAGCLGYLEKAVKIEENGDYEWQRVTNADNDTQGAACYRYGAVLDRKSILLFSLP